MTGFKGWKRVHCPCREKRVQPLLGHLPLPTDPSQGQPALSIAPAVCPSNVNEAPEVDIRCSQHNPGSHRLRTKATGLRHIATKLYKLPTLSSCSLEAFRTRQSSVHRVPLRGNTAPPFLAGIRPRMCGGRCGAAGDLGSSAVDTDSVSSHQALTYRQPRYLSTLASVAGVPVRKKNILHVISHFTTTLFSSSNHFFRTPLSPLEQWYPPMRRLGTGERSRSGG